MLSSKRWQNLKTYWIYPSRMDAATALNPTITNNPFLLNQ